MKTKKIILAAIILALFIAIVPTTTVAQADMGPKPSVLVNFTGIEGQTYYATLLSEDRSTGPHSAALKNEAGEYEHLEYSQEHKDYDVFIKFLEYEDKGGYYFLQFFSECTKEHKFVWGYYPPEKFKILLYFPQSDTFIVGQVLERYAFHSNFSATVDIHEGAISSEKAYEYLDESLSLLARIILTIFIELGIALLFLFGSKKRFLFIALINIITQVLLNITINLIYYKMGEFVFLYFLPLEFFITFIEAVIFSIFLKRIKGPSVAIWKPIVYAIVANIASFVAGLALMVIIPNIF